MEKGKIDMSAVSGALKRQQDKAKAQEAFEEEMKALKQDADICFGSPAGKKIAKAMMGVSGIYNVNKNVTDPALMGEHRGMAKMYLIFVKGMCSPDVIAEIERPTQGEN